MKNLKIHLSDNQLIDNILCPCVADYLRNRKNNKPVTLKDIYGLHLWLKIDAQDRRRFGLRFWFIHKSLGFKKTGEKRGDANLYVPIIT